MARRRIRLRKKFSRKLFRRTAGGNRVHPKNGMHGVVMRGGYRL